jgi:hypothetical protein
MIIPNRIIVVITKELRVVPNLATSSPETIGITVLHKVSDATNNENWVFVRSSFFPVNKMINEYDFNKIISLLNQIE